MSEPERLTPDELRTLFLFERLDDDQLDWLAATGRIVEYPAGARIHTEGAPASCFLVLLSGTLTISRRVQGGELELTRTSHRGAYTGAFNFYLSKHNLPDVYPASSRAVHDCRLFELPAAELGKAFREWYPMATHLLEGVSTTAVERFLIDELDLTRKRRAGVVDRTAAAWILQGALDRLRDAGVR